MEGPFRLLLVAGLLAALLPAAAATFGPQPGTPCEPTLLATKVSLFCAPDMPTAQCCEPVVAAVDLGGGVPCLCRVAAEPQLAMAGLNATHLLTLYTSCGGLRPGGADHAAACEGPAPPATVVSAPPPSPGPRRKQPAHEAPPPLSTTEKPSPPPQQHDGAAHSKDGVLAALLPAAAATFGPQQGTLCEPTLLATKVSLFCAPDKPTAQCCEPVVAAVDLGGGVPCLCRVAAEPHLVMAGFNATRLLTLYTYCGGLRPGGAHLAAACEDEALTPPPSTTEKPFSPPPSTTEKPFSPSQQHDGAAHSKALSAGSKHAHAHLSVRVSNADGNQAGVPCDFPKLAAAISDHCGPNAPDSNCCMAIVTAVDISGCLCKVILEEPIITGPIGGRHILFLYNACGGIRPVSYQQIADCDSPAVHTQPIINGSGLAPCNDPKHSLSVYNVDRLSGIYNVARVNTSLLIVILFIVSLQAVMLIWMYVKARRYSNRAASTRTEDSSSVGVLRGRVDPRITQSDGGTGGFPSHHLFMPYARARVD